MSPLTMALLGALVCALAALTTVSVQLGRTRREARMLRTRLERTQQSLTRQAGRLALRTVVGTAARVREQGVGGFLTSSIEELTGIALADRSGIARVAGPDGTVTVLFSDICDSTALNERLGDAAWVKVLGAHDAVVRRQVERHRGHIVKSQGDGFMIVFGDAADAIATASAVQQALASGPVRRLRRTPISVRMGLHRGSTIERDGDYFGRNVALAARITAQADGGEILVSDAVQEHLADGDVRFVAPREVALKGFPGTHRVWEVAWP